MKIKSIAIENIKGIKKYKVYRFGKKETDD